MVDIVVYWRPGCVFCGGLLRGLDRRGVPHVRRNIWQDEAAAAEVRAATGGSETVPTVKVGTQMLVNPSVSQVVGAVARLDPHTDLVLVGPNRFCETLARLFGRGSG